MLMMITDEFFIDLDDIIYIHRADDTNQATEFDFLIFLRSCPNSPKRMKGFEGRALIQKLSDKLK